MTRARLLLTAAAALTAVAVFYPRACSDVRKEAVVVQADRITVSNLTGTKWTGIDVWLNDHYRGQASALDAGQRLDMPVRRFVAGWGQTFDPKRQAPYGVEVTATGADGTRVRLTWGQGRRR